MARPKCCRRVQGLPACRVFKPAGVPVTALEEIVLSMDEFEALRLADMEGLYQEHAAERMSVSRQTFGRIVQAARRKVAQALTEGLCLRIEGGEVEMPHMRTFTCHRCRHTWNLPSGTGRPEECPQCKSTSLRRTGGQYDGETCGGSAQGRPCRTR